MNTHSGTAKASVFPTALLPLPEWADLSDTTQALHSLGQEHHR